MIYDDICDILCDDSHSHHGHLCWNNNKNNQQCAKKALSLMHGKQLEQHFKHFDLANGLAES